MNNKKCLMCDRKLIGRQTKYCSDKCCWQHYSKTHKKDLRGKKKKYREEHREEIREYNKEYRNKNKTRLNRNKREYRKKNPDKVKEYNDKTSRSRKEYYQKNKEKILKNVLKYRNLRYKEDTMFRLNLNMASSIRNSLRDNNISKGGRHWEDIVGYTVEKLKAHLERLFKHGMTWENREEWHIDHIIPLSFFKYNSVNDVEFKYCWSLNNLQPLWAEDNMKKADSLVLGNQIKDKI